MVGNIAHSKHTANTSDVTKGICLSASLMCGNLLHLSKDIDTLSKNGIDYFHLDVMDGHFVPNITFGFDLVNSIHSASVPKDIHLMVHKMDLAIERLKVNSQDIVTFHIEANGDTRQYIELIKAKGARAGIAINPTTPLAQLLPFIETVDHILIMTVEPGFAGSKFAPRSKGKIQELAHMLRQHKLTPTLGVDGAIGQREIKELSKFGVNHFVLGTTALFNGANLAATTRSVCSLKMECRQYTMQPLSSRRFSGMLPE